MSYHVIYTDGSEQDYETWDRARIQVLPHFR